MGFKNVSLISLLLLSTNTFAFDWRAIGDLELLNNSSKTRGIRETISTLDKTLSVMGVDRQRQINSGAINRKHGLARSEQDRINQGNTKFEDIPHRLQNIQQILQ